MRLQGNIDAAVNGGVSKYRKAFFTPEFCAANPGEFSLVECLAGNVEEQAQLLGELLELHGDVAPEALQPLHDRLAELYLDMKTWMVKSLLMSNIGRTRVASIVNTPLPPVPCHSEDSQNQMSYGKINDTDDTDNCYHEVIIGDPAYIPISVSTPVMSVPGVTKVAPPLPPRGVKTALTMSPGASDHHNYTHVPSNGVVLPPRLSTFQCSPPPLMRKLSGKFSKEKYFHNDNKF